MEVGQTYKFSDWYQSNVSTGVTLMFTKTDGSIVYQNLRKADSASDWTNYQDTFTVPLGTSTVTVFHLIAAAGYLVTDDYSIVPSAPAGFNRPLLSLTFDDNGWTTNYATALPLLNQYGFRSTQYWLTGLIDSSPEEQYKITDYIKAGHEIGSHTISHPNLTTLDDTDLNNKGY